MEVMFIVAVILISVALVLDIVAVAIPYWRVRMDDTYEINHGLWRGCTKPFADCERFTDIRE